MDKTKTVQIKIYSPTKVYFSGPGYSLSAINDTGPFDILAEHKNFISLLKPCDIRVRKPDNIDFVLPVTSGVLHVKNDKLTVFLEV
jgi:F0F1-type ATP synthase epsilon subunit